MLVLRKPYTSQPQTVAGIAGTQPQSPWSVAINFTDLANLGTAKDVQPVLKSGATLGPSLLKSAILGISGSAAYVELGTSTSIRANEYAGVFAFIPRKNGAALFNSRADATLGFVIYVNASGQVTFDHRGNIQLLATSNTVNLNQVNYLSFSFFGSNPLFIRAVLNGVLSTNSRSFVGFTQGNAIIGRQLTTDTSDAPVDFGAFFLRPAAVRPNSGGDNQLFEWAKNPWGLFVPQRKYIPVQIGGAVTHATTGALTGQASSIAGTAARTRQHPTTGTLTGPGSSIVGSASRTAAVVTHDTTGILIGPGSVISGSAARTGAVLTHDTTGVLTGPGALLTGTANHISLYPDPSDVREGVQYGPGGIYTGTLTGGGGSTIIRLRSFTERH
jgi:hypothetical protein